MVGPVTFTTSGNAGDILCLLSAARTYARLTGQQVYVDHFPDVIACYDDQLIRYGRQGNVRMIDVTATHRLKTESGNVNYLGTFVAALLPSLELPVPFELPIFDLSVSRCLIQPFSRTAKNPPLEYVQEMVDTFIENTGKPLFAVGLPSTPRNLLGVDYSLLEASIPHLMQHIASAECILTPRSASAHIAAAYCKQAYVWLPPDGENWHLDYPGWDAVKVPYTAGIEATLQSLAAFCQAAGLKNSPWLAPPPRNGKKI